ncbi:HAMP domain-containing sensor histidine kinase [Aciduricibacillus chroicocephali]|uniref:histidine kinase n=1 Tax=Aciduricibacillus chroicocephali TaxID=3054939 RepID=A0ABY9KUF4_9BACI|nr:HAMP domain-containing sensor histidine kinase [Bacillaceae bacterium 44XB]
MFLKRSKKRIPIQRYWTSRYLITLVFGLSCIAIISAIWVRHNTLQHRLDMMVFMSHEIAGRFTGEDSSLTTEKGKTQSLPTRDQLLDMSGDPLIYISDMNGNVLSANRAPHNYEKDLPISILQDKESVHKVRVGKPRRSLYVAKAPIEIEENVVGWVVVAETKNELVKVHHEYRQLGLMIVSLALLGWAAIYILSKRLSRPIKRVSKAARQIQAGDYKIILPEDMREEEVYDLVISFKEMSQQLQRLEALRTELLAGVTHELKTPITSISGLLQALNDKVVSGEEADQFLEICLKETEKMKHMVGDLLDFNAFASNAVAVNKAIYSMKQLAGDFVREWNITHEGTGVKMELEIHGRSSDDDLLVDADAMRFHQIMTNLANNAVHAMDGEGKVTATIRRESGTISVTVRDTGTGIPDEEQELIFERFYRGENKKYKIGGLGLGLPYSKMMAQAMGGDLQLVGSSEEGTIFRLDLPTVRNIG